MPAFTKRSAIDEVQVPTRTAASPATSHQGKVSPDGRCPLSISISDRQGVTGLHSRAGTIDEREAIQRLGGDKGTADAGGAFFIETTTRKRD